MTIRTFALCISLALILPACQTVPPVPELRYYRLYAPVATSPLPQRSGGDVCVLPLRAEGLYNERAILFSSDGQRLLQQYHYQYWLYPPTQLVQDYLVEQWRQEESGRNVRAAERGGGCAWQVSGRILRFERVLAGNKAVVQLELSLEKGGLTLWRQTYAAEESQSENSISAFVVATENALRRIAVNFDDHTRTVRRD